ncbi:MAG: CvpA family protein [SAR324 cluster bacterium]|nr:CvpA family protein [SAR324 cluster bacterium]
MEAISYFDIFALVLIVWMSFSGYRKGFLKNFFPILGLVAGLIIGLKFGADIGLWLNQWLGQSPPVMAISGIAVIIVLCFVLGITIGRLGKAGLEKINLGVIDNGGGLLWGGFKGLLIVSAIAFMLGLIPPMFEPIANIQQNSVFYKLTGTLYPAVRQQVSYQIYQSTNNSNLSPMMGNMFQGMPPQMQQQLQTLMQQNPSPQDLMKSMPQLTPEQIEALRERFQQ